MQKHKECRLSIDTTEPLDPCTLYLVMNQDGIIILYCDYSLGHTELKI